MHKEKKVPNKKVKKVPHNELQILPGDISGDNTQGDNSSKDKGSKDVESIATTNITEESLPGAYSIPGVNDISSENRGSTNVDSNAATNNTQESLPGAYSIAGTNDVLLGNTSNNGRGNNGVRPIVYSTYIHNHVVEPVIFASAAPPSFLQNKRTRNRIFGFVLVTSLLTISWSIVGSRYPSNPSQKIEQENFILKSMNLDNIAIHIRGVVSVNDPVSKLLWINTTNEHIKDFYEANEDFGIIVAKIETIFLEDIFTEQEDTGMIEIRYSQVFNFYTKDNSTIAENFALTPFSTRQGKITYIASLKIMNEMYSNVYDIGGVFTFTSYPSGSPTTSIEPSISTSPTDLASLYPTSFPSHIPSVSVLPTMAYSLTGWSIAVEEISWILSKTFHHTLAVSDDLVWIARGVAHNIDVSERNDSGDYSLFQTIPINSLIEIGHILEMDKDGTVLIIRDLEAKNNIVYSLSVYFRKDTKETFKMQQRLDGDSNDNRFGWRTSMTPNGLILVVLSELIHIFSRDKSEDQFLLHHTINVPERFLRRNHGENQIAVSADGLILIVMEGNYGLNTVHVFSRNPTTEFTLEQMLDGEEEGDLFGHTLALSRSGNLLVVAAPYASPKLNKEGSIHLYVRNETNKFNHYRRFDGASSFEYLGIGGTMVSSTESMLAIHASGVGVDAFFQTYTLECECANKNHICQGFSAFPALVCDDMIPSS